MHQLVDFDLQISEIYFAFGTHSLFILSELTFYFMFHNTFRTILLAWYDAHQRDLPWRRTTDPYRIWISEVILQQTRVKQGLGYYERFIERFPDVHALASAPGDEVMRYWQGLGYYSRARNLHTGAKQIVDNFNGVFPADYADIRSIRGVGEYTAAAIASFSFRLPYAVVDGNVYRVLSRLLGIDEPIDTTSGKKYFARMADELLDQTAPDRYNQAIMEFGALQCVPVSPDCSVCPLMESCAAFAAGRVSELPVKIGKTRVRSRWFNYFMIRYASKTWIRRREEGDIWSHLYEFPLLETDHSVNWAQLIETDLYGKWFGGIGVYVNT